MTRAEIVEIVLIAAAIPAAALAPGRDVTWTLAFGKVVGYSAALLLGQGLLRDVLHLALVRRAPGEGRRIACLCAESTLGLVLVAAAVGLTLIGIEDTVALGAAGRAALVAAIVGTGFVAKDYVISVRKERDHASVIVW
jgi:hypothetical protein